MACQEMKTHLDSGNSKHDVTTINPPSSYKLHEDRMWEGKECTESVVRPCVQEKGNESK